MPTDAEIKISSKYFHLENNEMSCTHPNASLISTYGEKSKFQECELPFSGIILNVKGVHQRWRFNKSLQKTFNLLDRCF